MTYVEHSPEALGLAVAGAELADIEAVWTDYVNSPKIRKVVLAPHEAVFYEGDPADPHVRSDQRRGDALQAAAQRSPSDGGNPENR